MNGSMQHMPIRLSGEQVQNEEFITIIAPTLAEVWDSFRAQGLAEKQYAIVHRAGRHAFTVAGDGNETTSLFGGASMVAATFSRKVRPDEIRA